MSSPLNDAADSDQATALRDLLHLIRPLYQVEQVLICYNTS